MKLILANNQTERFVEFYKDLQNRTDEPFEYAGYKLLLFEFDTTAAEPLKLTNLASGKSLRLYDGVYINGYLDTYELAAAVAISCEATKVNYVNKELADPPSLSKLTMYAKLAAASVPFPRSLAGTKLALSTAVEQVNNMTYPAVLKRADADRGIDNYKVSSPEEVAQLLEPQIDESLWILQAYVENNGFYLLNFYGSEHNFCIYRSLEERPDGNVHKAHMYKPKGGSNASLIEVSEVPKPIKDACLAAIKAMNRQIASVDCIYNPDTQAVNILEVNYNPQLVTIETFKNIRIQAFLRNLPKLGQ